jgi:hypothetical protein
MDPVARGEAAAAVLKALSADDVVLAARSGIFGERPGGLRKAQAIRALSNAMREAGL